MSSIVFRGACHSRQRRCVYLNQEFPFIWLCRKECCDYHPFNFLPYFFLTTTPGVDEGTLRVRRPRKNKKIRQLNSSRKDLTNYNLWRYESIPKSANFFLQQVVQFNSEISGTHHSRNRWSGYSGIFTHIQKIRLIKWT